MLGYFEKVVGFKCPEGKNVAEFLRMSRFYLSTVQSSVLLVNSLLVGIAANCEFDLVEIHTPKGSAYKMDQLGLGVVPVEEIPTVYKYSKQGQAVCLAGSCTARCDRGYPLSHTEHCFIRVE